MIFQKVEVISSSRNRVCEQVEAVSLTPTLQGQLLNEYCWNYPSRDPGEENAWEQPAWIYQKQIIPK